MRKAIHHCGAHAASPAGGPSPPDGLQEAFRRIAAADPSIRAFVEVRPHAEAARVLERASATAPLHGVPFGVKDLIDVEAMPTRLGLAPGEYRASPARRTAAAVARLERQGAVAVGKTVTSALALDRPGPTRNPHDLSRTPGASSSGSAAAVAAGMVPLALGSQSVGSVIRPASYCGVWAFVPSRGAVPREGTFVLSDTLDRVGVFADSADLLSLAAGALLDADPTGVPAERPGAPRIAVLTGRSLAAHAPEPLRLLAELAAGERLPLHAVEADIDLSAVLAATRTIGVHELHRALGRDQPGFAPLDPAVIGPLVPPDPGKDAYESALEHARLLAGTWDGLMAGFDACLLPSAVAAAPRGPLDDQDASPAALGSLLGLPTVGMPLFTTAEGLPLGCQLLARRGGDSAALRLSAEVFHALKAGAGLRGE